MLSSDGNLLEGEEGLMTRWVEKRSHFFVQSCSFKLVLPVLIGANSFWSVWGSGPSVSQAGTGRLCEVALAMAPEEGPPGRSWGAQVSCTGTWSSTRPNLT